MINDIVPSMRWNGEGDFYAWQSKARSKLRELLGIDEIEACSVEPEVEIEYDVIAEDYGCREIRFRYSTEEGVTVPGHIFVPDNATGPLPALIALVGHGSGMHIYLGRPMVPEDEPILKLQDRHIVRRAVNEGCVGIAIEPRAFGENGGHPETMQSQCRETALRAMLLGRTLVGERVWDIMKLIDVIEKYFSDIIDTKKIICLGNSGGGTMTTYASALDERIAISVPSCAVCDYADSIGFTYHCNCNFVPKIANYFDMGDICAMIAPRKLIVVSGRHDTGFLYPGTVNSVEVARDAYQELDKDDKIVHVIGRGGHQFFADPTWPHIHDELSKL